MKSVILTVATRYLMPLMFLFSIFALLRGHNDPGGGFVGGLVAASGFALYAIAFDVASARRLLRVEPVRLIGVGLLIAVSSGLAPLLFTERPFMTGLWGEQAVPAIGKLGTPFFFDVGVYVTVIGVTLLIIFTLAED